MKNLITILKFNKIFDQNLIKDENENFRIMSNFDSLAQLDLLIYIETNLNIKLSNQELIKIKNLNQLNKILNKKIK